jgi:hypothetical protein
LALLNLPLPSLALFFHNFPILSISGVNSHVKRLFYPYLYFYNQIDIGTLFHIFFGYHIDVIFGSSICVFYTIFAAAANNAEDREPTNMKTETEQAITSY